MWLVGGSGVKIYIYKYICYIFTPYLLHISCLLPAGTAKGDGRSARMICAGPARAEAAVRGDPRGAPTRGWAGAGGTFCHC